MNADAIIFSLSPLLQNANANSLASMDALSNLPEEERWPAIVAASLPAVHIAKAITSYNDRSEAAWDAKTAAFAWLRSWERSRRDKNEKTSTSVMSADMMIASLYPLFENAKVLSKEQIAAIKTRLVREEMDAIAASALPVEHLASAIAACAPTSVEASRMRAEVAAWRGR